MAETPMNSGAQRQRDYGSTSSANIPGVHFAGISPTEFISLRDDVAFNINEINSSLKQLERCLKSMNNIRDRTANLTKIHSIQNRTNEKIQKANSDLQRLTSLVMRDAEQKFHVEKLTDSFFAVVESYSKIQNQLTTTIKERITSDENRSEEFESLPQEQRQLQSVLSDQSVLIEQETKFRQIECDMLDLNGIMKNLHELVLVQGGQVDSLETTIENVGNDLNAGRSELEKASNSGRSYRKKILIILVIAIIVGIITTAIVISKVNN